MLMLRVALATVAAVPATAQAYWDLTPDGHPRISMNVMPAKPDRVSIAVCPPGGADCTPVTRTSGDYLPGETAVGTAFEIRVDDAVVSRSPAWQGRVAATAVPTISGKVEIGQDVRPLAGGWTGGWGDEYSRPDLLACATPEGTGCMMLPPASACPAPCFTNPDEGKSSPSGGDTAALPPAVAGRYLIALDQRLPRDQSGWPLALRVPRTWTVLAIWNTSEWSSWMPTTVSAPVQIQVPPPIVALRQNAQRVKGQIRLGQIACRMTCKVSMKVSGGKVKASTTTFTGARSKLLTTPPGRHGTLTVRVHIDGQLAKTGQVIAR